MEESLLNKVSSLSNYHTITKWNNDKWGYIIDLNSDCLFRFIEVDHDEETDNVCEKYRENEKEQQPVIACGFVGWLIKYKGNITVPNVFINFSLKGSDNPIEKDTIAIFDGYLNARLNMYKKAHKDDPDLFKRDLEKEFYSIHKEQEMRLVEKSKAINEFLPECDIQLIQKFVDCYFEYASTKIPDTEKKKKPLHFTRQFTDELRTALYNGLTKNGFIPADTPRPHFDFVFGGNDRPQDFKPLQWQKSKETIRLLVVDDRVRNRDKTKKDGYISKEDVKRQIEKYFTITDRYTKEIVPCKLSNPREERSHDPDCIEEILKNFPTS